MGNLLKIALFLSFFMSTSYGAIVSKIIGGKPVTDQRHPGFYNTVALLKTQSNTVFCTGSIISQDLIVTAKHCLADKKLEDFSVFFGESHHRLDEGHIIEPQSFDMRYPTDWQIFFPSFDVAWIKLKKPIPSGYRPIEVLKDPNLLSAEQNIDLVGFGNHNPNVGQVDAGDKLWGQTRFNSYLSNARYYHILYFSGDEGQGTCHGDSGGPAYAKIAGKWYLIGVANGFDPVITTQSMSRRDDPDFPFDVNCSKNQILYSFVGAHLDWIIQGSQIDLGGDIITVQDRDEDQEPSTLLQWCESKDFGSPKWNLLKDLLNTFTDKLKQNEGRDYIEDCKRIANDLENLKEYSLDFKEQPEAHYDLSPLALIPGLKSLKLKNVDLKKINLKGLEKVSFDSISITYSNLKTLSDLPALNTKLLKVDNNPLASLEGIQNVIGLEQLDLSRTKVVDLTVLETLKLKTLNLNNLELHASDSLKPIQSVEKLSMVETAIPLGETFSSFHSLTSLTLSQKSLTQIKEIDLSNSPNLSELVVRDLGNISLKLPTKLPYLRKIALSKSSLEDLSFLASSPLLEEVDLFQNNVSDLSVFSTSSFPYLKKMNLNSNPVTDVTALKHLTSLTRLLLRGTPLHTGEVIKNEKNCPTSLAQKHPLTRFCTIR